MTPLQWMLLALIGFLLLLWARRAAYYAWERRHGDAFVHAVQEFLAFKQKEQRLIDRMQPFLTHMIGPPPRLGEPPRAWDTFVDELQHLFTTPEATAYITALGDFQRRVSAFHARVHSIPPPPNDSPFTTPWGEVTTLRAMWQAMQAYQ